MAGSPQLLGGPAAGRPRRPFRRRPFPVQTAEEFEAYSPIDRARGLLASTVAGVTRDHGSGSILHPGSKWARQALPAAPPATARWPRGRATPIRHRAIERADTNPRVHAAAPAVVTPIHGATIEPSEVETQHQGLNLYFTR